MLITNNIDNNKIKKSVYSLSGKLIDYVVDEVKDNQLVRRKIRDNYLNIKNNEIIVKEKYITLPSIKQFSIPKDLKLSLINPNFGVIDLETFEDKSKVMAAGLFAYGDTKPRTNYIDKDNMDSDKVIYILLDILFENKYENYIFYCHNLGGFDSIFLIKYLVNYNKFNE